MTGLLTSDWFIWGLVIAYTVTILSIVGVVLSENRNPVKSLAWVTVLILFPIGGIILYIFFGRSIRGAHMISRRKKRQLLRSEPALQTPEPIPQHYTHESRQQITLARSLTGARFYDNCRVEVFADGASKFARLKDDLRNARQFIHLQYYIFEDDKIGHEIRDILIDRAKAGVKVRVIYDHIGSIHVRGRFFREMQRAGIEVYPFFRVAFPPFATKVNWRNHRKVCVIDGVVGYVGGMNIADRYLDGGKFGFWRDVHLRLTGPGVASLHFSFAIDWSFMGQPLINTTAVTRPVAPDAPGVPVALQYVSSGPTGEWSNVAMVLLKAIGNAKRRVLIQTPYFLPTESMLRTLQTAALAKVDVRVMIPRHSDSRILTYAGYSYIRQCLRAGIKIYLYEAGMLHSKVVIIDDDFCSIGSANIDFRSFEHNFEGNMMLYSPQLNTIMRHRFAEDISDSTRISINAWRKRPLLQKVAESIVRLLSPIL